MYGGVVHAVPTLDRDKGRLMIHFLPTSVSLCICLINPAIYITSYYNITGEILYILIFKI
uniref:Uncharacterized protein n=1 Tax=Papilio xuthus TaxID=66420 RepID=I4DLM1_PAPXU|nr:unknown unsecreted protein [Papilio xuthus]